tara:strand:+ start:3802 stop:4167 length:366 start_codon:yes stop_codon:yes gene_type:complete
MTEEAKEYWTIDELVDLTDKVQTAEIEHQGKFLNIQWCELVESEEPKFTIDEEMSEEEKNVYYQNLGKERCLKMLLKANEKQPDNALFTKESWELLPSTLKYKVQNTMLGVGDADTSFQNG